MSYLALYPDIPRGLDARGSSLLAGFIADRGRVSYYKMFVPMSGMPTLLAPHAPSMPKRKSRKTDKDLFEESTMTFGEHLEALRKCLFKSVIALIAGTAIGLSFGWGRGQLHPNAAA